MQLYIGIICNCFHSNFHCWIRFLHFCHSALDEIYASSWRSKREKKKKHLLHRCCYISLPKPFYLQFYLLIFCHNARINVQCFILCTWECTHTTNNRARILRNGNHNFHSVFNGLLCTVARAILCEKFFSFHCFPFYFMPFHELFSIIDHIYDRNDCERECQVTWFFAN